MVQTVLVSEPDTLIDFERSEQGDWRTEEMLVNMGPQHPSTHGVLRMVLSNAADIVLKAAIMERI